MSSFILVVVETSRKTLRYRSGQACGGLGSPRPRPSSFVLVLALLLAGVARGAMLDIGPPLWGFDRQAFLDWLRRGGQVHILLDRAGRRPVFSGELAALNAPQPRSRVGAGLVVRHAFGRRGATQEALAAAGCPAPRLVRAEEFHSERLLDLEGPVLRVLSQATRPRHAWGLIYLTTIAYVIVLGPVNLAFGRRRGRNYRITLLFFLVSVASAAALLHFLGRRGAAEAAAVHSLALARQIDADTYDVTQWTNLFATRGGAYEITHDAPHNLYAACQDTEAVPGFIVNGKDGAFRVEIPYYSHRSFLHRAKLRGHHIRLSVLRWREGRQLEELALAPEPGFPEGAGEMWLRHADAWYRLERHGGELRAAGRPVADMAAFFSPDAFDLEPFPWGGPWGGRDEDAPTPERLFAHFPRALIARQVGGTGRFDPDISCEPLAPGHAQAFIFTPAPRGFGLKGNAFGRRVGYVLYCIELFKPTSTGQPPAGSKPAGGSGPEDRDG